MNARQRPEVVGEIRPSQLLYTFGIGNIIDLPEFSVLVMGLDDWPTDPEVARPISEDRLLAAVRSYPGLQQVGRFLSAPVDATLGNPYNPNAQIADTGVPVATFPRWMVCPECRRLASVDSGLFQLQIDRRRKTRCYVHTNCSRADKPAVVPARFVVACENGHLDDFPWLEFVHEFNPPCDAPRLRLNETGISGEARDLVVKCENCGKERRPAEAFGRVNRRRMPNCLGRRPHLRDYDPDGCKCNLYPLVLGASNLWFPSLLASIAIPGGTQRIDQLVQEGWAALQFVNVPDVLEYSRATGQLGLLSRFSNEEIWAAIQRRRQPQQTDANPVDLLLPEWRVFANLDAVPNSTDFRLRQVAVPGVYAAQIERVVLVERLREVRVLRGFTRIDSPGEAMDGEQDEEISTIAPLARSVPTWLPANEVRGEGVFLQFSEAALSSWLSRPAVAELARAFRGAHIRWCRARKIDPDRRDPGLRYVLLHSFAHALMRQLAMEAGYSAASIRERIYARDPSEVGGPMAGILLYTAAPDSEGTLGGLVRLGETSQLERIIPAALESMTFCASDPTCAEHVPSNDSMSLHGAACHACMFAPETSCERGNRYLDRSTLITTFRQEDTAFFTL